MAIRAVSIEIWGLPKERRQSWLEMARMIQRMTNRMWQHWLVHHTQQKSPELITEYLDALAEWRTQKPKERGDKPKLGVKPCDKDLSNHIYHAISQEFTGLNARTRVLLQNQWQGKLTKRKASNGNLSGWMAILLGNESIPSATKPQPIPFDKKSSPRDTTFRSVESKLLMDLRIERVADTGASVIDTVELLLNRRKTASVRAIVKRIMTGEYTFKGSSLSYRNGKWFANISYDKPVNCDRPVLDQGQVIMLVPGKKSPWIVKTESDCWRAFGRGDHVVRFRRMLQSERWSRQEHNRWASSSTKGRGAKRAKAIWTKLSSRWKDFVKTYNNEMTRRLVDLAVSRGIGRIVYVQPKDEKRDQCFLSKAGRHPRSKMTWDWFQVGTMLKSKCEDAGIELEVRPWSNTTRAHCALA